MLITVTGSSTLAQPSTCGPIAIPSRISSTIAGSLRPLNAIASGATRATSGDDRDRRERDHAAIVRPRRPGVTAVTPMWLARLGGHAGDTAGDAVVAVRVRRGRRDRHAQPHHGCKAPRALSLVREGRVYDLGRVLDEHVPVFPGRAFHQTLVTTAHHANRGGVGENRVNWITEVILRDDPARHAPRRSQPPADPRPRL